MMAAATFAVPSQAAVNPSAVDALSGFPFSYVDDAGTPDDTTDDLAIQFCQDESGNCIETPVPHPADPIAVPGNFTEDGEAFYFLADATVPNAGIGLVRLAKEAAFTTDAVVAGDQITFSRIRFKFTTLTAGAWYRVTYPYGTDEFQASPDPKNPSAGIINSTVDLPAAGVAGDFATDAADRVTSILRWDSASPAAPSGYIGAYNTPHTVVGSPLGTNYVQLDEIDGPGGLVVDTVGRTDKFNIQGKIAGAPPAPTPNLALTANSLSFGSQQVGTASDSQSVTITNRGTAPMNLGGLTLTGASAASYVMKSDCGATLAPGASCTVDIAFSPTQSGTRNATLAIADNAIGAPHSVSLTGTGTPATVVQLQPQPQSQSQSEPQVINRTIIQTVPGAGAVAPQQAVSPATAQALTVSRLTLAKRISITRLRAQGLRLSMRLSADANLVRIAVYRARNGKKTGRALYSTVRVPHSAGLYRVTVRNRSMLRKLRAGQYVAVVQAGRSRTTLGRASTIAFRVNR